jgi:23S rRNA pseudouridine1911/1915/1917 synthase
MAYIGHPCVGDQVYGKRSVKADHGLTRQFLHAYRIEMHHPITGEPISLRDPLPDDLLRVVREIEPDSMGRTPAGDEASPDMGL